MMTVKAKQLDKAEVINLDRCYAESDRRMQISRRTQALLAAAGMDGNKRWYVIRVANGADKIVDKALEEAKIERWMPVKSVRPYRRGKRKWQKLQPIEVPVLPGYVFVRLVSTAHAWAGISTIKGVLGVLGGAERPASVSDDKVLKLRVFIERDPDVIEIMTKALTKGDRIRVEDGPFASFPGVVEEVLKNGRALIEVMIFGRAVMTELDLAQITKSD